MTDLISRQAAIKAIDDLPNCYNGYSDTYDKAYIIGVLEELPPIEPKPSRDWNGWENGCGRTYDVQPKKGKWIRRGNDACECSECRAVIEGDEVYWRNNYFCYHCGAKMADDWEEPEINPCRGCDDYDGRGGCKSHGGCGAESSEDDENWYTELDDPKIAERCEE